MTATAQIGTAWGQAGFAPVCALQVFGMRRSGNHAIIDWLMRNAPQAATGGVFFNNCRHGRDPLSAYGSLDIYDAESRVQPHHDIADAQRIAAAGDAPMVVVSYEDRIPQPKGKPQRASQGFATADFSRQVIIYRSFLNWAASLLAKIQRNDGFGPTDRMRIMGLAFATYVQGLDRVADPGDVVAICYDDWMQSEDYRAGILDRLDLPRRDLDRGQVQRYGGGSSFQRRTTGVADLGSTERDALMAEDEEYKMILWTAAHDVRFMERILAHFEDDAERLAQLAETASLNLSLPLRETVQ
ncbi:hypothetical protein ABMC89_14580 [Sulfitobacter sp. HNIBRBA3233]|uniref:hypothetical protein n=1 Tax=Sulfitobacter marinivivus TaxID=3158558 RepID=UPI0032DF61E0